MARLWSSGAELQSVANGMEFDDNTVSGGGALAISTSTKRSGSASLRSSNAGANGVAVTYHQFKAANDNGPFYARAYINFADNTPAAICTIFALVDSANTNTYGRIRLATNGSLELWDNSAKIGSSSSILSTGTWYRVELYFYNNTGTGKLELDARIDGVSFASTTTSTATGTVALISLGDRSGTNSYDMFFDDIAVNDNTGSFQNSWAGDGQIVHLVPSSAGTSNQWRKTDRTTAGDSNNYTLVDDTTPPNTTDFVWSKTLNDLDDYTLGANGNIASGDTINVVELYVRGKRNGTNPATMTAYLTYNGGTDTSATWQPNNSTTFKNYTNVAPYVAAITAYNEPGASTTAFTKTTVEATHPQIKITTGAATNGPDITAVWVLVDYTAGSPPATPTYIGGYMTTNTNFWGS